MRPRTHVLIATIRPWNIRAYRRWRQPDGVVKHLITDRRELTYERLARIKPRFVFFPHWSWFIPPEIFENFECVGFHPTDLPFGRGGTPLANLLVRGIYRTKVTAFRIEPELDAGPVYRKRPFSMARGSCEEIYTRMAGVIFEMIDEIITEQPIPRPQRGKVVVFKRRQPKESRIPEDLTARQLYDFIRMLDAPEYPAAFTIIGRQRIEFRRACLRGRTVEAEVVATPVNLQGVNPA